MYDIVHSFYEDFMRTTEARVGEKPRVIALTPRHYKILDYCISGLTPTEIAKKLKMTKGQVSIVMNSPSFQHQFAMRRAKHEDTLSEHEASELDTTKELLQKSALVAANKLVDGMSSCDERIKLKSATEILDRTGYSRINKDSSMSQNTNIIINSSDMNVLKETLQMVNVVEDDKIEPISDATD